jgi:hypothetical protein
MTASMPAKVCALVVPAAAPAGTMAGWLGPGSAGAITVMVMLAPFLHG